LLIRLLLYLSTRRTAKVGGRIGTHHPWRAGGDVRRGEIGRACETGCGSTRSAWAGREPGIGIRGGESGRLANVHMTSTSVPIGQRCRGMLIPSCTLNDGGLNSGVEG
jgi:hypothetical protein